MSLYTSCIHEFGFGPFVIYLRINGSLLVYKHQDSLIPIVCGW